MSGLFPFASGFHHVWSPFAEQIHAAVWERVGLSTVQGFVRQWSHEYESALYAARFPDRVRAEIVEHWAESLEISERECCFLLPAGPSFA